MRITIQAIVDDDNQKTIQDVAYLEREGLSAETLGLTLQEAKMINSGIQKIMTDHQVMNYTSHQRPCAHCGKRECFLNCVSSARSG